MTSRPRAATAILLILSSLIILNQHELQAASKSAPESIDVIQAALPDSLKLEGKVVYVDFWASWCMPCRDSFSWMREIYKEYHKKGFEIIAVNVDKDHGAAMKFLEDNSVSFPILYDSTGTLAKTYQLQAMPTSYVYGSDGKLVEEHCGFEKDKAYEIKEKIAELLYKRNANE